MRSATINLRNDSPAYEQFTYPAGEHQVRFRGRYASDDVTVIARISNGEDIVKLALLKSALEGVLSSRLVLPYLPYSRADRRFTDGDCYGLKAFGGLIDSMGFGSVLTLDAHNPKTARQCIANLTDVQATGFIDRAIVDFAYAHKAKRITVVFPDEGARTRYQMPKDIETNTDSVAITVAHCNKKRDAATGKLQGFEVPEIDASHPAIIIDDICDGGATFNGIAGQCSGVNLALYVTHGIFSKGTAVLLENFAHIYTTDSLQQMENPRLTVFSCSDYVSKAGTGRAASTR